MTSVLICDDHPVFRDGLSSLLASANVFEVVGEAASGDEAVALAGELVPDVIVMDLNMPGLSGIEATRAILKNDEDARILVLTMFEDDDSVFAAVRAGALGYVLKGSEQQEIIDAVSLVARGQAVFGPGVARRVISFFSRSSSGTSPFPNLTAREAEIVEFAAQGLNNAAIARRLSLSEKTVRNNISTIFQKLHVSDRAQLVAKARDAGVGETPKPESP